jgi:hypothetical protein
MASAAHYLSGEPSVDQPDQKKPDQSRDCHGRACCKPNRGCGSHRIRRRLLIATAEWLFLRFPPGVSTGVHYDYQPQFRAAASRWKRLALMN